MKRILSLLLALCLLLPALACAEDAQETPRRVVYLTFDDGPKKDTPELLALLGELDVPATFFLVGLSVRAFPEYAKMIVDAGHAVGCHSMSHSYSRLKSGTDYVGRDLVRFTDLMRETVGEDFSTDLYRFPGGSSSYASRTKTFVRDQGYAWFDWNGLTGDTLPGMNAEAIVEYAISTAGDSDVIILLAHEGKKKTRDALAGIVEHYRSLGYEFRTLSTDQEERAILSRCPAPMRLPAQKPEATVP